MCSGVRPMWGWVTGHSYVAIRGRWRTARPCCCMRALQRRRTQAGSGKSVRRTRSRLCYTAADGPSGALMKLGEELPAQYDLSKLRLLGSVGEPIISGGVGCGITA